MDEILRTCLGWLNEYIVLRRCEVQRLEMDDMYRFVSVLLLSHCTGFSFARTIRFLSERGSKAPSLERVRFICSHILAFSPTGRGGDGGNSWVVQRDLTPLLTQFEQNAFRATSKVFLVPTHLLATLDDDLYGTRANDNQVKTLSARKADKEGHTVDAIADALFRITLAVRFRRRGESQTSNVRSLIEYLMEGRGEQSMHGFVITADRGYGRVSLMRELMGRGIGSIMVMPEHLMMCHPFVGRSYFSCTREDEEEGEEDATQGQEDNHTESDADIRRSSLAEEAAFDRPRSFVIDDSPSGGNASWFAVKSLKPIANSGLSVGSGTAIKATAVAVRERGSQKFSKVLRFIYNVPTSISQMIETWIAVPYSTTHEQKLFSKRTDSGLILHPPDTSPDLKDELERRILQKCVVLTVGQRCADWFVMRQFRVTGVTARKIVCSDSNLRTLLGLPQRNSTIEEEQTSSEFVLRTLMRSWFSAARSTEAMMRGTANEVAVFAALASKPFVRAIYECGMLGQKFDSWLACSPDGVALLDVSLLSFDLDSSGDEPHPNTLSLASIEIKTSVSRSSLDRALQRATMDIICCTLGDAVSLEHVPEEHVGQVLHQMVVMSVNYVVYVSAAESSIMYIAVVYAPQEMLTACEIALRAKASAAVSWAYEEHLIPPSFVDSATKKLLKDRLVFWKLVNDYVKEKGAFPPLKLFKHGAQSLYSKTKGGIDGSAQARAVLRSSTSSLRWEQKIVCQTMKTLAVNAFIAWRMSEKRSLLQSREEFHSLKYFRNSLNAAQSFAEFIYDTSTELLAYADELRRAEDANEAIECTDEVSPDEVVRLRTLALRRKKKRLWFFNGMDGIRLRTHVRGHEMRQQREHRYCALCGLTGASSNTGWRGHRSTFKCSHCDVHLCVRTYPGFRKSCWDVWHTAKKLTPRSTPQPSRSAGSSDGERSQTGSPISLTQRVPGRVLSQPERGKKKRDEASNDSQNGSERSEQSPNPNNSTRRKRAAPPQSPRVTRSSAAQQRRPPSCSTKKRERRKEPGSNMSKKRLRTL